MACTGLDAVTLLQTAAELKLFGPNDPYRYDVDNRPLLMLLENDKELRDAIAQLQDEICDARIQTDPPFTFPTLADRLDSLTGAGLLTAQVNMNILARAETLRKFYDWGFLQGAQPAVSYGTEPYASLGVELNNLLWRDEYTPFSYQMLPMGRQHPFLTNNKYEYEILFTPADVLVNGYLLTLADTKVAAPSAPGTVSTPTNRENRIKLLAGPSSDGRVDLVFLEVWLAEEDPAGTPVFYPYGNVTGAGATTDDPTDPSVAPTVDVLPSGMYVQVRYRIRVVSDVDWDTYFRSILLDTASVKAQGPLGSPGVSTYSYYLDPGMAPGTVDATLGYSTEYKATGVSGAVDGVVYGMPLCVISRRNTGTFTTLTQNGGTATGGVNTVPDKQASPSDRYDMKYADRIYQDEILDLRPWNVQISDFSTLLEQSLLQLTTGHLGSQWGQVQYGPDDGTFTNQFSRSTMPMWCDLIDDNPADGTNLIRDWEVPSTVVDDPPIGAFPDDTRYVWSAGPVDMRAEFEITANDADDTIPTNGWVTYDGDAVITARPLSLSTGPLSGYLALGDGGPRAVVKNVTPVLFFEDGTAVPTSGWGALGTETASTTLDCSGHDGELIRGYAVISYVMGSGLRYKHRITTHQTVTGAVPYSTKFHPFNFIGGTGTNTERTLNPSLPAVNRTNGRIYVPCRGVTTVHHKVQVFDADLNYLSVFPSDAGTAGTLGTGFNQPWACAVHPSSGVLYVADKGNNRIAKFTSASPPVYTTQYTSGFDGPIDVDVDSSGNMYVYDGGNNRIVKLDSSGGFLFAYALTGSASYNELGGCLAVDRTGSFVAVSDITSQNAGKIKILKASDLTLQYSFGSTAPTSYDDLTKIARISCLDWDSSNHLLAVECNSPNVSQNVMGRILRFTIVGTSSVVYEMFISSKVGTSDTQSPDLLPVPKQSSYGASVMLATFGSDDRMVLTLGDQETVILAHESMAFISKADRRIEMLRPLKSNESLAIWYTSPAYQGLQASESLGAATVIYRSPNVYMSTSGTGGQLNSELGTFSTFSFLPGSGLRDIAGTLPIPQRDWEYSVPEAAASISGRPDRTELDTYLNSAHFGARYYPLGEYVSIGPDSSALYGALPRGMVKNSFSSESLTWLVDLPDSPGAVPRYLLGVSVLHSRPHGLLFSVINLKLDGAENRRMPSDSNPASPDLDCAVDSFAFKWNLRLPKNALFMGEERHRNNMNS